MPVDYADPNGAKIGIAVLRAPAKEPSARLGAVVIADVAALLEALTDQARRTRRTSCACDLRPSLRKIDFR